MDADGRNPATPVSERRRRRRELRSRAGVSLDARSEPRAVRRQDRLERESRDMLREMRKVLWVSGVCFALLGILTLVERM